MRRVLLFVGLAAFFVSVSGYTRAQVTTSTSDLTGVTRIASADLRPLYEETYAGSHAAFRAVYERDPDGNATWSLAVFGFAADTTSMGRATTLRVVADGDTIAPTRLTSETRRTGGSLLEVKRAVVSRAAFERIATAESVTIAVGPNRFVAIRARRADLRRIFDRAADGPSPTARSAADTTGG